MTDQVNEAVQYRKKPVVIEAMQLAADPSHEFNDALHAFMAGCDWCSDRDGIQIETLEGTMHASPGDWIIKGVKGEFYPCKPDIFAATYEPAAHPSRGVVDEETITLVAGLERTIVDLGEHRETHVVWRDWLNKDPANAKVNPHAGSAEFHAGVIIDYDRHLSNIRAAIAALQAAALPAVPSVPEDGWQPIETIPRDESRVELLSANGKTDNGRWCNRPDWVGHTDDIQDYLDTDNGEGSYTHWRPLAATPKDQPAQGVG